MFLHVPGARDGKRKKATPQTKGQNPKTKGQNQKQNQIAVITGRDTPHELRLVSPPFPACFERPFPLFMASESGGEGEGGEMCPFVVPVTTALRLVFRLLDDFWCVISFSFLWLRSLSLPILSQMLPQQLVQ